ncbi:GDSL family lysophospholipase PlaA [Legionella micdadei]|uniref:GDSL family lysophospholipase PlaA n=1 Tax=Legionella micdadei TaxID=451 RepID=UPI0009EF7CA9|nr:SGNH/GDSL hydrolase family protein [Legionella micdadei]ARG99576.1 lysophospholipase [Legionella micdadei]
MKALFISFVLLFSGFAQAQSLPLNNIVVFGDSLSDNGNLYEYMGHKIPQSPPYFSGRFSNGPIWVERLVEYYFSTNPNSHLLDYAFGGAGISDEESDVLMTLKRELDIYLNAHQGKASENNLYIVWIGANNYIGLPSNAEETVTQVNKGIVAGLKRLVNAGAKYIMVVNIPDLGKTPIASDLEARKTLSNFSKRHNAILLDSVGELQQAYPDVKWMYYDVRSRMNELLESPESYGFTNIVDTCYAAQIDKSLGNSILHIAADVKLKANDDICKGYLFFDPVHPTAPAHSMLAENAKAILDSEGVQFGE